MIQTVIQNPRTVASYVYLRDGIYYFQLRLKKGDARLARFKSGLIRKSLKTGNYREAVMQARLLWFEYMTDKKKPIDVHDEIDADARRRADLFTRGKELYESYEALNHDNEDALDWFYNDKMGVEGYTLSFDREAFQFYNDYLTNNPTKLSDPKLCSLDQKQWSKGRHRISEMIEKFISDNQSSANPVGNSQLNKYKVNLKFFCDRMNDCYVDELTSQNIRNQYVHSLHLLPAHAHRYDFCKDNSGNLLPYDELVSVAKIHKLKTIIIR